ncbi:MAG: tail tape measure [Desulfovibrionaceae bacterium]|nr:MAG: tail tape measure [Desulfovibrionaceae bacterium]
MKVGNLEFLMSADTRSLDTSLRNSEGVTVAFAEKTSKQFKRVQSDIESVGKAMGMSGAEMKRWEDQAKKMLAESAASKAFERAAKAAGASEEAIRKAGAAMGLTTKQAQSSLGAMSNSADLFRNAMLTAGAAFGALKLADFVRDSALAAARFETLGVVMEVVGRNAGIAKATMDATATSLQKQGIAMVESRDATVKLTQAGIDLARATELGRIAQDAAVIGQMNSSQAFMHMVTAIQSAQPEMLRTIGMNVSFEDSYKQLAAQTNKSAEALTEQEKMVARVGAVMESGKRIAGTYEAAMGTAGKQISSFTRYMEDLKTVGGEALQEGLSDSVVMATQKIKEFTEYLKTGEAKAQIAAIGKTGEEAFSSLVSAGQKAGEFLGTVASGWNSLPSVVQEFGLVAAVVGGPKALVALGVLSGAVGETRNLFNSIGDAWGTSPEAKLRDLENTKKRIEGSSLLSESGKALRVFQVDKEIAAIKAGRGELDAERLMLNDSLAKPLNTNANTNTKPIIPETWGDLSAQAAKVRGSESGLSDQTRREQAQKEFKARYDLSQRMYGMAQGDSAKMAEAVAVERDAYHSLGTELESINKKHKKAGEDARKSSFEISEAMNKALGASESWNGDAWSGKFRTLLADLDKDLKNAKTPLEEYWARWEYGAKKAQTEFEKWTDLIKRSGAIMSELGQLSFDPSMQMTGDKKQLAAEWLDAVKLAGGNQEEISRINQLYQLKEVDLREKTLGDVAQLDEAYWARRKNGLTKLDAYLQQQGVSEQTRAAVMSQKMSKIDEDRLKARLGYEDSFGGYLSDRLALQYGLYKDAAAQQLEVWEKTADATIELFDGVMESFTWAMGQGFGDLLTGKLKTIEDYTQQLLAQLKQVFANWLTEMARIAANKYIVVPIMGQIMGTSGSLGAGAGGFTGEVTSGSNGFSLEGAMKYGGYAKDAYGMFSGPGAAGAASLASEAAQGANFVGPSVQLANAGVPGSSSLTTLGALGAGAAAGGIGYMAGGFIRPDNPMASYVGAGAGLIGGTVAGMASLGALAATGVGALVAIPAALAVGLTQGNTEKSEWTVPNASKSAIMIAGGENTNASYGVIKTTSSGAFGSSSTSHKSIFGLASPEMAAQQDAAWAAATKGLDGFTKAVGVSESELTNAKSSFNFPAIPIPDGMDAEVYRNVANAEAEHTLAQLGMLDAIKAVTKDGEAYIDTLTRLDSTFSTMENLAISTGFGLEQVAAGMDRIVAADYASRLMEAAGGADAFAAALSRLNTYGYSAQEQMERSLTGTATATGRAIAEIGNAEVTIENFWPKFRQAMESGMDPDRMAAWVTASARMEQWEQVKAAWQQKDIEALQTQTSTLQAQISVIQQVSSAWKGFGDQMVRLKQSLLMDANLSTLSPEQKMYAAKTRLDSLTSEANNKSTDHLADIDQATKDYLSSSLDFFGATADYYAIFDSTSATIDQLTSLAGSQVSAADQQVASLNFQIEQNNAQITALNTINSGLGDVVAAVNNVSQAIGGAIQSANAAQQSVSIPQWAASAVAADSAAASSPYAGSASSDGQGYADLMRNMGWSVPAFAEGGTTKGGWFVAGDDPLSSRSGELMYSASPVKVFNNKQSRSMLAGGGQGGDTSALEAKMDAVGSVLVDILNVLQDGGGTGAAVEKLTRVVKVNGFKAAGA